MSKHRRKRRRYHGKGFARVEASQPLADAKPKRDLGAVHPNSMAARKWGRTEWLYRG